MAASSSSSSDEEDWLGVLEEAAENATDDEEPPPMPTCPGRAAQQAPAPDSDALHVAVAETVTAAAGAAGEAVAGELHDYFDASDSATRGSSKPRSGCGCGDGDAESEAGEAAARRARRVERQRQRHAAMKQERDHADSGSAPVRDAAEVLAEEQDRRYAAMVKDGTQTLEEIQGLKRRQRHAEEVDVCE